MSMVQVRASTRQDGLCRGCRAPIVWYRTKRDQLLPFNADVRPHEQPMLLMGPPEYVLIDNRYAHWATCPQADQFRKR
jgi:hypothetical protein